MFFQKLIKFEEHLFTAVRKFPKGCEMLGGQFMSVSCLFLPVLLNGAQDYVHGPYIAGEVSELGHRGSASLVEL
jgi:hypothetical protein